MRAIYIHVLTHLWRGSSDRGDVSSAYVECFGAYQAGGRHTASVEIRCAERYIRPEEEYLCGWTVQGFNEPLDRRGLFLAEYPIGLIPQNGILASQTAAIALFEE